DNRVSVVDTATNTIVGSIPLGTAPLEVAITPNGAFGYVPALFSDNVTVFDTARNMVVTTIPVGSDPLGVAISPNGARAYVSNHGLGANSVSVIDTATNTVTATIIIWLQTQG
uniref:YncE family protein n=1 Tax=Lysinibacillus sp. D4A3_S15 TaxID=2941227 RepID=UPI0037C65456